MPFFIQRLYESIQQAVGCKIASDKLKVIITAQIARMEDMTEMIGVDYWEQRSSFVLKEYASQIAR